MNNEAATLRSLLALVKTERNGAAFVTRLASEVNVTIALHLIMPNAKVHARIFENVQNLEMGLTVQIWCRTTL